MSVIDKIISLYAPHVCVGCGYEGSPLCDTCYAQLAVAPECCYRCYVPSRLGRTCTACSAHSSLLSVNSATVYNATAKAVVAGLKFERKMQTAEGIGAHLARRFASGLQEDVIIVPIPTATKRVRSRGYDQAQLIARALARQSGCRYVPALARHGQLEQKGANRQQRQLQIRGAVRVTCPDRVRGARIMLVDDVLTTGATVEEAARVLKLAGARAVGALVFARA